MVYHLANTCKFLLSDAPVPKFTNLKYSFPAINHLFAYKYAELCDSLIDFSNPHAEGKVMALGYHKLLSHTFKHIIHKYKKCQNKPHQYKVWAVYDFHTKEGKYFNYMDYPRIEDLYALKRELLERTPTHYKIYEESVDVSLDKLNLGVLSDLRLYSVKEFKEDFDVLHEFWGKMIEFIKENQGKRLVEIIHRGNRDFED